MNHNDYKNQCNCGDYSPYRSYGVLTAPIQPYDSCINCYHKVLAKNFKEADNKMEGLEVRFTDQLTELRSELSNMSEEERNKYLNGVWVSEESES